MIHPTALLHVQPMRHKALARDPGGPFPDTEVGEGTAIGPYAVIYAGVKIGKDCLIGDGASIREGVTIGDGCVIGRHVTVHYNAIIRERVIVQDNAHITGGAEIRSHVFIGPGVVMANDPDPSAYEWKEWRIKPPFICDRAMIGAGAILCPGAFIGFDAKVFAGAVVAGQVPDGIAVAGCPARPVPTS